MKEKALPYCRQPVGSLQMSFVWTSENFFKILNFLSSLKYQETSCFFLFFFNINLWLLLEKPWKWQQSAGIEWQLPPNLGACERPVAIVPPLSSAIVFALAYGLFSSAYKPNVISLLKAVNLDATCPASAPSHFFPPLCSKNSSKCAHTHTVHPPAPILSAMLRSPALVSPSPPQRSRVTKHAVSQDSSKSAQELPLMLALRSPQAPLLSLRSAALQALQLLSFPFSQASVLGKT